MSDTVIILLDSLHNITTPPIHKCSCTMHTAMWGPLMLQATFLMAEHCTSSSAIYTVKGHDGRGSRVTANCLLGDMLVVKYLQTGGQQMGRAGQGGVGRGV